MARLKLLKGDRLKTVEVEDFYSARAAVKALLELLGYTQRHRLGGYEVFRHDNKVDAVSVELPPLAPRPMGIGVRR